LLIERCCTPYAVVTLALEVGLLRWLGYAGWGMLVGAHLLLSVSVQAPASTLSAGGCHHQLLPASTDC
jgi:hypothetical protein